MRKLKIFATFFAAISGFLAATIGVMLSITWLENHGHHYVAGMIIFGLLVTILSGIATIMYN